jgi:hypothetical protein
MTRRHGSAKRRKAADVGGCVRVTVTLRPDSAAWLRAQPNISAAVDALVQSALTAKPDESPGPATA